MRSPAFGGVNECCEKCQGRGAILWVTLSGLFEKGYVDSVRCPECKGTGGWKKQPKTRLTLCDLEKMAEGISDG